MRRNQVTPVLEVVIQPIAVIDTIANEMFGLGPQHVEVKTELHQCDLMMIRGVRTDRERQPMTIHNHQVFTSLPRQVGPIPPPRPWPRQVCIDKALTLVERAVLAQRIDEVREDLSQHIAFAPLLEPAMDRL